MERAESKTNLEQAWTPENFASMFGFREIEGGFMKEIKGIKYKFKPIKSPDELLEAQNVLRQGFGWDEIEIPPRHILALFEDTGGGCFSAFNENGEMVGFAGGMGGGTDTLTGKPMLISSMAAMKGIEYRSAGIGKPLKIIQAYYAKQNGYDSMKWLYDPERGENASLNMKKLGARAEEFWIDKYGRMGSGVFGGVPTDRFRAVWRFANPKTVSRLLETTKAPALEDVGGVEIATETYHPFADKVLVEISPNIDNLRTDDEKYERRMKLRNTLLPYFPQDKNNQKNQYFATEFISGIVDNQRKNFYLLEPMSILESSIKEVK